MSVKKYTLTHVLAPSFFTLNGQKYLMPGWIPVEDDITFSDVEHINPYKSSMETFTVEGSSGNKYTVTKRGNNISCDCPAGKFRGKCKHIDQIKNKISQS